MHELQHEIARLEDGPLSYSSRHFWRLGMPWKEAHDLYRRQTGEVEARNAQSRMHMSDRQRRLQSPQRTEDIPRDQQIHTFDGR